MSPLYHVKVFVDVDQDLRHTAYVYAGIFDLMYEGRIDSEHVFPAKNDGHKSMYGDLVVTIEVSKKGATGTRRICFDLKDQSYEFQPDRICSSDVYFKRSFYAPDVDSLAPELRAKVRPFGLNFACRSSRAVKVLLHSAVRNGVSRWIGQSSPDRLRYTYKQLRKAATYARLQPVRQFERPWNVPAEPLVLFQTRLWTDDEVTGEPNAAEINHDRAEIVRTLKQALGKRFVGGLLPTPLAVTKYPELLCGSRYQSQRAYLSILRRCLVGVYSIGLHHSLAFKMSEYLAGSLCIVSEPLRNQLPEPLTEGGHYLLFNSPENCLEQCERLLGDPALAISMRRMNYEYYESQIRPSSHIMSCLDRAFSAV